jgi:hypothetical protein
MSRIHELLFTGIENKPLSPNRGYRRMYVNIQKRLARQADNHKTARHSAGDQLTGFHIVFEYDDRESFSRGCHSVRRRVRWSMKSDKSLLLVFAAV